MKSINWWGQWNDETNKILAELQPQADAITERLKQHLDAIEAEPAEYLYVLRGMIDELFMRGFDSVWLDKLELERAKDPERYQRDKQHMKPFSKPADKKRTAGNS